MSGGSLHLWEATNMAILYWKNVSTAGEWGNVLNWFTDAAATVQASEVPWTQSGPYDGFDLEYATGEVGSVTNDTFIGSGFTITGTCRLNVVNNGYLLAGTYSGNVTNNGNLSSPIFTGAVTNNGWINSGTYSGTLINGTNGIIREIGSLTLCVGTVTNNGEIWSGKFSGEAFYSLFRTGFGNVMGNGYHYLQFTDYNTKALDVLGGGLG